MNEYDLLRIIFPLIIASGSYSVRNLEDLTDDTIVKVTPDIYDGADSEEEIDLTELDSYQAARREENPRDIERGSGCV